MLNNLTDYLSGYFHRNKKIFIISIVLFIALGCVGICFEGTTDFTKLLDGVSGGDIQSDDMDDGFYTPSFDGFIGLFLHNLANDYMCLFGGLFLFIPTILFSYVNSRNFISLFIDSPISLLLLGILPHGIFEIPSSIFAMAGGMMFFTMELKLLEALFTKKSIKREFDESKILIGDAFVTAAIIFVLLFIAALIETYITPELLINFYLFE